MRQNLEQIRTTVLAATLQKEDEPRYSNTIAIGLQSM